MVQQLTDALHDALFIVTTSPVSMYLLAAALIYTALSLLGEFLKSLNF